MDDEDLRRWRRARGQTAPDSLSWLRGPATGHVWLPAWIAGVLDPTIDVSANIGKEFAVDLTFDATVVAAYQQVITRSDAAAQIEALNRDLLIRIWPQLTLPDSIREVWETSFPELTAGV
ncbi:hypothetical protein E3T61_09000 [Cryobacterium lactosi]|uniref:Uncharacterized protein n=1 Tax=Cryobacterium lactosi TaxID=1259202 RepID=A0A4R9BV34_9MICO|nr:hypothetical protein [Cryobacterium lactosi]TFD91588.1 hypothetical protein E3T61_09000 [Cryobacterium lactosi]